MKTLTMVASAGMLMSAAPAPAPSADRNALCFIAMGEVLGAIRKREGATAKGDEGAAYIMRQLYFYGGALRASYTDTQLIPVMNVAITEWRAMSPKAREGTADCLSGSESVVIAIAKVVDGAAAATPKSD